MNQYEYIRITLLNLFSTTWCQKFQKEIYIYIYSQEKIVEKKEGNAQSSPWDMSISPKLFLEQLSN